MQKFTFSLFCSFCLLWINVSAQSNIWTNVLEAEIPMATQQNRSIIPDYYQSYQLDMPALKNYLTQAPMEFLNDGQRNKQTLSLEIPMPNGRLMAFEVQESPVMMPRISQRYPQIRSYRGYTSQDPNTVIRFVVSPLGFHATLNSPEGEIYIDPYVNGQSDFCQSYYTADYVSQQQDALANFSCGFVNETAPESTEDWHPGHSGNRSLTDVQTDVVEMRVYRLAIGATGEWTQKIDDGSVEAGLAAMNVVTARLNLIFEAEMALRVVLVDTEDQVIFTNPGTDPYTNSNSGGGLLGQNTEVLNNYIGVSGYDFGHVFTAGCSDVGGIANLGSVCGIIKGAGVTCHSGSNLDRTTTQITAHEMGHQLGSNHTFNNCGGNENFGTGFEPGGGSTIMSYSGLCGFNSFQGTSDNYYHVSSLVEIYRFSFNGPGYDCPQKITLDNHFPEVDIPKPGGFYIPISTPFELTAEGRDEDDDALTYCWEEYDKSLTSSLLGQPQGSAPLFRSFPGVPSPTRIFPRIQTILTNGSEVSEVLPTYSRDLKFRCTVRDNNPLGGVATWSEISFKATDTAGPFLVTSPNTFVSIQGGSYEEITWDVANTDQAPVNCKTVDILLSKDGGYTFTDTLAVATKNDGSHFVYYPDISSTEVRIKVKGHDNVFFDLSNRNFQVYPATTPGYTMQLTPSFQRVCNPNIATFEISSSSLLGYNEPINLVLENLPPNTVWDFSKNPVLPGESSTLTVDFTESNLDDEVSFQMLAIVTGSDTITHNLGVNVVSVDFSDMVLQSPANGKSNVPELTDFSWSTSSSAESYDIEISYSPLFEELVYSATGLTEGYFEPTNIFEKNILVYWRVRPNNECGPGPWSTVSAFHTENFDCSFFYNQDVNLSIGKSIGSVTESTLFISESGTIEDLEVDHLDLEFAPISGLDIRLISPSNQEVILMTDTCANTGVVKVSFDDEAPNRIICPPNGFEPYQPKEPLSIFDGQDIKGEWKLRVEVLDDGFTPGKLKSWNIETCAGFVAQNPYIVVNNLLPVRTNDARVITADFLEVKDNNNSATQLTYVIVDTPKNGTLETYGSPLQVGSTFPQDFIYGYGLKYIHNGNDAVEDAFYFTVTDGNGGFIGVTKFEIEIDPNNPPVGTFEPTVTQEFRLIPNPARDFVNVQLDHPLQEAASLQLFDLSGRRQAYFTLAAGSNGQNIATNDLLAGIYIVQLHTGQQVLNKKLIIVR